MNRSLGNIIADSLELSVGYAERLLKDVTPEQFAIFRQIAQQLGFKHAACGPMVRSSYHADQQAQGAGLK